MKIKPAQKSGGVIVELGPRESQISPVPQASEMTPLELFRLKKILVPVDFTPCTDKALLYAIPFAKQFEAELTLLHVLAIPFALGFDAGAIPEIDTMEDARKELDAIRDRFVAEVECETVVRNGTPAQEIVSAAKELNSDLIILATHGRIGLERLVLGSTAEKVVRHAGCPVLIVREAEHEFIARNEAN